MQAREAVLRAPARGRSLWAIGWRRLVRKKVGLACLIVIAVMYLSGILAPWVAPYGYNEQDLHNALQKPSLKHPFGTDRLGRDLLSRVIFGLRTTVIVTVAATVTGSIFLGIVLGLAAGYLGRRVDAFIMRIGEVFLAFPGLLLVILIAATVKPRVVAWAYQLEDITGIEGIVRLGIVDYLVVFGALASFSWVGMARLVRGQVLSIKQNQFVEAAHAIGAPTWRILLSHLFPNILSPVIVVVSISMGSAAGSEVVLSWLGLGIQPPTPSLGVMIFENGSVSVLRTHPHLLLFPVAAVTVLIFAFNLLGDALNDALNPRAR
jgi:ABC-type dipeptide/oligopeptide/nickel transport system permease subunit